MNVPCVSWGMMRGESVDGGWHAAYLLHRKAWKESSWLADFLVASSGRVRLVVRGARRQGRQGMAWMQPFVPMEIQWRGRSTLPTLIRAEPAGPAVALTGLPLLSGFYINELLQGLMPERERMPRLFELYRLTLPALASADRAHLLLLLRRFELALLETLGHGLDRQRLPPSQGWWRLDLQQGWQAARPGQAGALQGCHLQWLREDRAMGMAEARSMKGFLHHLLHQLRPGVGDHSRALLDQWIRIKESTPK